MLFLVDTIHPFFLGRCPFFRNVLLSGLTRNDLLFIYLNALTFRFVLNRRGVRSWGGGGGLEKWVNSIN